MNKREYVSPFLYVYCTERRWKEKEKNENRTQHFINERLKINGPCV